MSTNFVLLVRLAVDEAFEIAPRRVLIYRIRILDIVFFNVIPATYERWGEGL